jgi:hypothetical protein
VDRKGCVSLHLYRYHNQVDREGCVSLHLYRYH